MSHQLLSGAFDEAQRATADVRAAAYLHIARVLGRFDRQKAQSLVDQAVAIIDSLDDEAVAAPELKDPMQAAAIALAATVSPATSFRLIKTAGLDEHHASGAMSMALFNMMSHGFSDEAIEFLSAPFDVAAFPFEAAMNAMGSARVEEDRLRILRAAIAAMRRQVRAAPAGTDPMQVGRSFPFLFTHYWRRLPADEARDAVREIARWIVNTPDRRMTSGFGGGPDQPRFSSSRAQWLYQFLSPLQHLDPDLTRSLIADHAELAKAAARYPYGMDSVIEGMEAQHKDAPPPLPPLSPTAADAVVYVGHHAIPVADAIATGFEAVLSHARQLHVADAAPGNAVPCECWPSTSEFRAILHAAGEVEGQTAERLIDRVPIGPARLLASIELAAALAGLPRLGGSTMSPRPRHALAPPVASVADLPAGWPRKAFEPLPPARKPNRPPSLDVHISPTSKADGERPSGGCGSDFWVIEGVRLRPLVARLCDTPEARVGVPDAFADRRYDFVLVLPTDATRDTMTRLMRYGIERHFGVAIDQRPRLTTALVLSAPEGLRAEPGEDRRGGGLFSGSVSWSSTSSDDDGAETESYDLDAIMDMQMAGRDVPLDPDGEIQDTMKRFARLSGGPRGRGTLTGIEQDMTMGALCELLESSLGQPVVDETGATGTYALKVEADGGTTASFLEALWEQTGLTVTAAPREVPMVVVHPVRPSD